MVKLRGKCEKCGLPAKAKIRTFFVCPRHFYEYKRDNIKRVKLGIDIPKKLVTLEDEEKEN